MGENNNVYEVKVQRIESADELRPAAITFEKYGYYTIAPPGTTEYIKYWKEQLDRSVYGYTTPSGLYVPGFYYFYLNFTPIQLTKERVVKGRRVVDRVRDFPKVYDYDLAYFLAVEKAQVEGKHLSVLKARGRGYSYKSASMLCRNFYCIPESVSYAVAAETEFLTKDGILSKAWEMMAFIDENTAFAKKRQKVDQLMHKRASFVVKNTTTGVITESGWKSEIIGITLKNDIQKIRGKRGQLFLFEEGGKFPGLKEAWQITRSSVEDGSIAFGTMVVYGTGGTEDADFDGLKSLFYEPDVYNILPIRNIWDEGNPDEPCGFFVPVYYNMAGYNEDGKYFMDKNGNSNIELAIEYSKKQREVIIRKASDRNAIDRYVAENCFSPAEACLSVGGNLFPKKDLQMHLSRIRTSSKLKDFKQVGYLLRNDDSSLKWDIGSKYKDVVKYPLKSSDDKTGAMVIWEHPPANPPYGLYIIGVDPYDHDKSGTTSLGSAIVWKRYQDFESYYDLPVAEYTARPETAEEYYEGVLRLAEYYNAKILFENEKINILAYFKHKNKAWMLADQPDIINKVLKKPTIVRRSKGMHMSAPLKLQGEEWIAEWLNEEYAPGQKNLNKIFSEPLLEELISYNDKGNFDRVMALMQIMFYRQELMHLKVKEKKEKVKNVLFKEGVFRYNK